MAVAETRSCRLENWAGHDDWARCISVSLLGTDLGSPMVSSRHWRSVPQLTSRVRSEFHPVQPAIRADLRH